MWFFFRDGRSFTLRKLYICIETFLCFLHQCDRVYVSPFSKLGFIFKRTMSDYCRKSYHIITKRKRIYAHYLLLVHSIMLGTCQKIINRTLIIIASHVTVGAQGSAACLEAFGKMFGTDYRRFVRSPNQIPSPTPSFLFFVFARSFVPFACFFGNACYVG